MSFASDTFKDMLLRLALATFVIFSFTAVCTLETDNYHNITVECCVTVEDGDVTVHLSDIPDEMLENIDIESKFDIKKYALMENGTYTIIFTTKYRCNYAKHHKGNCECTEQTICDVCKDYVYIY